MAVTRVNGKAGSVALPTGNNADIASFSLRFTQPVEDDTSYTDAGNGSSHYGAGTMDYSLACGGWGKANAAASAPGFDVVNEAGGAVTLTSKVGCTHAATFILTGGSLDHRKRAGAVPVGYEGINDGNMVETWAVS